MFSDGKPKKMCLECNAKMRIRNQPFTQRGVVARAAVSRAAADASPDVLDDERQGRERRIIVAEILSNEIFRGLPADATMLIFGTTRFRVGEASWTVVEDAMYSEASMSWQRRGGSNPCLLHDNRTVITKPELKSAGFLVELLYLSDRILDATGNVEFGKGAIEGTLIREIEDAHGITAEVRDDGQYRACVKSGGNLVNKSATARGCPPAAGMWGLACALILPQGWQSLSQWCLMDGDTVHQTAAQGQAARGSGGSYPLPPLGPTHARRIAERRRVALSRRLIQIDPATPQEIAISPLSPSCMLDETKHQQV